MTRCIFNHPSFSPNSQGFISIRRRLLRNAGQIQSRDWFYLYRSFAAYFGTVTYNKLPGPGSIEPDPDYDTSFSLYRCAQQWAVIWDSAT